MYDTSMILTGMEPTAQLATGEVKIFVSFYALYSGVAFVSTMGVFFAPFAHRLMHILQVEPEDVDV